MDSGLALRAPGNDDDGGNGNGGNYFPKNLPDSISFSCATGQL